MNGVASAVHMLPIFVLCRHTVIKVSVDHSLFVAIYYGDNPIIEKEVFVEAAILFVVGLRWSILIAQRTPHFEFILRVGSRQGL